MSTPLVDGAARERAREEQAGVLAVEAGAGTGKTTLLVGRIVWGLRHGHYAIQEVAAITFTRKAAGELRSRLRHELGATLEGAEGDERERLARALRDLPLARLSTIHAFCQRLIQEYALELGLPPDFEIADEGLGESLHERLWREWLGECLADETRAKALTAPLVWGGSLERVGELARDLHDQPRVRVPRLTAMAPSAEEVWSELVDAVESLAQRLGELSTKGDGETFLAGVLALRVALAQRRGLSAEARLRWLVGFIGKEGVALPHAQLNRGSKKAYPDGALDEAKQELRALRRRTLEHLSEHFAPLVVELLRAMTEFQDWAAAERRARGQLGQTDLLVLARELLKKNAGVRRRVAWRIRALLVDEYQDTDPLQAEIVELLSEQSGGPAVFLVGDPKQSIYRFRHADVATYRAQVDGLEGEGRLERIHVNFRSAPGLLDVVNRLLAPVFADEKLAEVQAPWQALDPPPGAPAAKQPVVRLAPIHSEEPRRADAAALASAEVIAAELQDAHTRLGARWSEMAVLFPVASRAHLVEEALTRRGIPFRQERSQRFFHQLEIAELAQLAAVVADPWDSVAAVATLRSRLFGIPDDALVRHRLAGGVLAPGQLTAEFATRGEPGVLEALEQLGRWSLEAREQAPPTLLESILAEARTLLLLEQTPHGERAAANVQKLLDQARAHWEGGGLGLGDFARWLRQQVEGGGAREAESPAAEDEDRVSLLTVHASKGLEWKVVALFGLDAGRRAASRSALVDRGVRQVEFRLAAHLQSPGYEALGEREALQEEAERVRLLYVALTRAGAQLILPWAIEKRSEAGSFLDLLGRSELWREWVAASGEGEGELEPGVCFRSHAFEELDAAEEAPPERGALDASAMAKARGRRDDWHRSREALLTGADTELVVTPSGVHRSLDTPSSVVGYGPKVGRAVHRVLEWWLGGQGAAELDVLAKRAAGLEDLGGEAEQAATRELVARAAGSPLLARAQAADECRVELPVVWKSALEELPASARPAIEARLERADRPGLEELTTVLVEGSLDLAFREGESWVVVDFKTDAVDASGVDALVERYRPQLELYAAGLSAATGGQVAELWLLLLGAPGVEARRLT